MKSFTMFLQVNTSRAVLQLEENLTVRIADLARTIFHLHDQVQTNNCMAGEYRP